MFSKKNINKRIISIFYALIVTILSVNILYGVVLELKNKYIKIIGDPDTGRFIFKTTEGDPNLDSDQNSLLLYEDYPPTSYTTIKIDGINYKFGDNEHGRFITSMINRDNKLMCVWKVNNIEVMEELRFVKGPTTGRDDTVEIKYTILNKDSKAHKIGIRIMLDTYLGKEDGAPFRVPGLGDIKTETELKGKNIPQYWYSYDDLSEPTVRAQGTLRSEGITLPDRVIFASWERFQKYLWDFKVKSGRSFRRSIIGPLDSAIAMYWEPKDVNPNESFQVVTYYGLYGASIYKGRIFNISLGGPVVTTGEPFVVTADFQNISPYDAKNCIAEVILPPGLKLAAGEIREKNLATLHKKEIKKTAWKLVPDKTVTGFITFKVKITGIVNNKKESAIAERKIEYKGEKIAGLYYDFYPINKLLEELNYTIEENNKLLEKLNKYLSKNKKIYSSDEVMNDKNSLSDRESKIKKINQSVPDAVKSVYKKK